MYLQLTKDAQGNLINRYRATTENDWLDGAYPMDVQKSLQLKIVELYPVNYDRLLQESDYFVTLELLP